MNVSQKAIEAAGGNMAVSKALNVTLPTVWRWGNKNKIRGRHVIAICEMTKNNFSPEDLRPDVFGSK